MRKRSKVYLATILSILSGCAVYYLTKWKQKKARKIGIHVPYGPYEAFFKRPLDAFFSATVLVALSPVMLIIAFLVRTKLGAPIFFTQDRPGMIDPATGKEKIFKIYKFRTMTDERGENGELLPDEKRLTSFGKWLRSTSLDELPELLNILIGDMSFVGPRPQLVRDMVFMDDRIRLRHTVTPGLSGLAQVNGRNAVSWGKKFELDLKYVNSICLINDLKILIWTVVKVFGRVEKSEEIGIADDYGDALLKSGEISQSVYDKKQEIAIRLLMENQ